MEPSEGLHFGDTPKYFELSRLQITAILSCFHLRNWGFWEKGNNFWGCPWLSDVSLVGTKRKSSDISVRWAMKNEVRIGFLCLFAVTAGFSIVLKLTIGGPLLLFLVVSHPRLWACDGVWNHAHLVPEQPCPDSPCSVTGVDYFWPS